MAKKTEKKTTTKKALEPKRKAKSAGAKKPAEAKAETPATVTDAAPANGAPATPPDPRLPPPGTLLQKRDRHGTVRCECTVEADGVRYAGKVYKSLSSAAIAAAKDLGLTNKTQNGFVFWGLSKPACPARDPMVSLGRAWTRYHDQVLALLKGGVTDDNLVEVAATIAGHMQAIESLREKVA